MNIFLTIGSGFRVSFLSTESLEVGIMSFDEIYTEKFIKKIGLLELT